MTMLPMNLGMLAHPFFLVETVAYILVVLTCNLLPACAEHTGCLPSTGWCKQLCKLIQSGSNHDV
jgi:hypothetical protein